MGYKSKIPLFCKVCGSKKVRWDKYFDENRQKRFVLINTETEEPHKIVCGGQFK